MATIARGRHTHRHDGQLAVFMIGFRINRFWKVSAWLPVFRAMPPMIRELLADPSSGFLGTRTTVSPRGLTMTQYWRGMDDVFRYAATPAGRTGRRGGSSTRAPGAAAARSASGTRRTRWPPASTSRPTSTCR